MALSSRHLIFVREYLKDGNGKQAAIRSGYSEKTAESQASRLLRNAKVAAAVDAGLARRALVTELEATTVLRELALLVETDIGDAFDGQGRMRPLHEMHEDVRRCIAAVDVEELYDGTGKQRVKVGHVRKVRFLDKTKAIELALRRLGLLNDKLRVSAGLSFEKLVQASWEHKPEGT